MRDLAQSGRLLGREGLIELYQFAKVFFTYPVIRSCSQAVQVPWLGMHSLSNHQEVRLAVPFRVAGAGQ